MTAYNTTAVQVSWVGISIPSDGTLVGYNVYYWTRGRERQSNVLYSQFFMGDVTQGVISTPNPQDYQFNVAAVVSVMGQTYNGTVLLLSGQNSGNGHNVYNN